MKAKRLTALALAALMAASTTSVALAGERVDADLDFANDGYYKYNSDTNRLESAKRDEFQPGDDVYLRLVEDSHDTFTNKKTYNAYADWTIGDSWVKDIDVVYRKGDITTSTSTTYDWTFSGTGVLAGWTASSTGLASQDDAAARAALKADTSTFNKYVEKYISDHYDVISASENAWTDNSGRYWKSEESAKRNNGITAEMEAGETKWTINDHTEAGTFDTEENLKKALTNVGSTQMVYQNKVYTASELVEFLNNNAPTQAIKVKADGTKIGTDYKLASGSDTSGYDYDISDAYVFTVNDTSYYVDKSKLGELSYSDLSGAGITGITDGSTVTSNWYITATKDYVVDKAWTSKTTYGGFDSLSALLDSKGIKKLDVGGYIEKGAAEGATFAKDVDTTAKNAINSAIDSATINWKSNTVTNTQPQYEYWVKITTKDSATTKDIDVVGSIWVGTSKSSAKKEKDGSEDKFRADFTLTNSDPGNDDYDEATDYVSIEPGERAVVSFADDASDEFEVEFGDDARFVFNARGQGKLNLAYNTKYDKDFAYDYDDANIDFINFEGEPTTNRTGTLYIYADEDSYIYEVTSKGAKKINGAYYDDDEEAWVIRTRNLTSYAISDKKLKTVDQMDNGSSSNSSNKPDSSNNKPGNGKPNPDTGR